ncbi:PA14 domain-containing protein [Geodermatophilus sp. SYSU D00691]
MAGHATTIRNHRLLAAGLALGVLVSLLVVARSAAPAAAAVPAGFAEVTAFRGLVNPTVVRFAPDGRVFVAEKRGTVQMYDSLSDTTATQVADLRTEVHNFWDRGLLGLEIDPAFPTRPYLYALYTFDGPVGGNAPRWGTAGSDSDPCPTPPGPTTDGCVVSGKLVRLTLDGSTTTKQDLIHDWCQQYPSHSVGDLMFGRDGALYVTAGDGASFDFVDYGQDGNPVNPCGDPPGGAMTPPGAQGGALRSQDLRTSGDPVTLDGTVIRVNPDTGAAAAGNPNAAATDLNARRIIAYGFRNPFRLAQRPGTDEVWIGDVGWSTFEEINRLASPTAGVANFGWPCFEGNGRQPSYDAANLSICENLYTQGGDSRPFFAYRHGQPLASSDTCNTAAGSSVSGVSFQFYSGGPYPSEYDGALFFADYSRNCVFVMTRGTNGLPNTLAARPFVTQAAGPVNLELSPSGELFYPGFNDGTIRRIVYTGGPTSCPAGQYLAEYFPNRTLSGGAVATACEAPPLNHDWGLGGPAGMGTDNFSGRWTGTFSFPSAGEYTFRALSDDGIRVWVDGTLLIDQWRDQGRTWFSGTRTLTAGSHSVRVEWYEASGGAVVSLDWTGGTVGSPPVPRIDTPAAGTTWQVGDQISFTGSATDPDDGALAASALSWEMVLQHCPSACHAHPLQSWTGVAGASISAPDHEYPSYLELRLTATDSDGRTATVSRRLDPRTVAVTVDSVPRGLQLTFGQRTAVTPFTSTVIAGSTTSLSAPSPQTLSGTSYQFTRWSDGGGQSHNVTVGSTAATYTATYSAVSSSSCPGGQYLAEYFPNRTLTGTAAARGCEAAPLNHDWGLGGPAGVGTDNFSGRWTGTFSFPTAGTYTFAALSDDGIRVWVDGTLLIDQWRDQGRTWFYGTRTLTAGFHSVRVEWYEGGGGAVVRLDWAPGCPVGQYRAEYFPNPALTGSPTTTRCEAAPLDRNFGSAAPTGTSLPADNFSARWTGTFSFPGGSRTFTAVSDDGVRVWLDGVLIIDRWGGPGTWTTTRTVPAGQHSVRVEWFEGAGSAYVRLTW